jgi:integrase
VPKALTNRSVETAKSGKDRREIPDGYLPSLYLVVQPTGAKSFVVRYRNGGRTRKHTLGSYPAINLKAARELGAKALRLAAEGRDPAHEARSSRKDGIEAVVDQFVQQHCRRANRPRTAQETERLLRSYVLPRWRGRLVHAITRRDVLDLLDHVVDKRTGKVGNSVLAAARKMLSWCVERDIIPSSPCQGVKKPAAEIARDRVLTDRELTAVLLAADVLGYPFGTLVKLLILTLQRRDEVARTEWSEVDLDAGLWTLPPERVKNNERHEVPLSVAVLDILRAVPRIADSRYVLTTDGTAPSSNYARNKRRLDALLPPDMPGWRLHDLRRTGASGMARLGIALPVIEKVLNHTSGSFAGIVSVYQRHSFADEKHAALDAWGQHVERLITGRAAKP